MSTKREKCSICHIPRPAAERGECNVPMPAPQPPSCLMMELEREVVCNKCGYGGRRAGHGEDGCPYAPFPIRSTYQPLSDTET